MPLLKPMGGMFLLEAMPPHMFDIWELLRPAPRRLDMLFMLDILPPVIRAARLDRLGLVSKPVVPPKIGFPILGMAAGTSLMISNPSSSFFS